MIRIRGASIHNLKRIDLDLPLGCLVAVTGVSGSGKSSLVFDTLHAEGRRRYLEALDASGSGLRRPPVDAVDGLPPTVALRQHERAPGSDQRLADVTGVGELLAVLFARLGVQHDPVSGEPIRPVTHDQIADELQREAPGSRLLIEAPLLPSADADMAALLGEVARAGFSRVRLGGKVVRLDEVSPTAPFDPDVRVVVDRLKVGDESRPRVAEALRTAGIAGRGVIVAVLPDDERTYVDRPFSLSTRRTFPELSPGLFSTRGGERCPDCSGSGRVEQLTCGSCSGVGLGEAARHVRLYDQTWPTVMAWDLDQLDTWITSLAIPGGLTLLASDIQGRIGILRRLRLGQLHLGRPATEVSAGEWQRVRLGRMVGATLSGVLYLLDEPTAGLAADVAEAVIEVLESLVAGGNSVIVVSHREAMVRRSAFVVDLGPGAGEVGGRVVHAGLLAEHPGGSPTADWLAGRLEPVAAPLPPRGTLVHLHNVALRGVGPMDVELRRGGVTVIAGPAGSGRATLLEAVGQTLAIEAANRSAGQIERALHVDRRRMGTTRSVVATFVGMWDVVRELLAATTEAKIRGLNAGVFSLAIRGGRCEACRGQGERRVDLGALPPVWLPCEVCEGRRFQRDVLQIRWKGRSAAQLLAMPADVAHPLLAGHPRLDRTLRALIDVGLGYLPLGQSTLSLSGGEAARLRLARELGRSLKGVSDAALLMDGPTDGLHPFDAIATVRLLRTLADSGATVVVSSVDPAVRRAADHVIDLSD